MQDDVLCPPDALRCQQFIEGLRQVQNVSHKLPASRHPLMAAVHLRARLQRMASHSTAHSTQHIHPCLLFNYMSNLVPSCVRVMQGVNCQVHCPAAKASDSTAPYCAGVHREQ
jgi:hypothetical protein